MERVTLIKPKKPNYPVLVVAPHGHDDPNTADIAEQIAHELQCYAVINRGWERSDVYDYANDKANCNNLDHLNNDVIKDEFLDPIDRYCSYIQGQTNNQHMLVNMFVIHGVSDQVRNKAKNLDIIVGHGEGKKPRHICPIWYRDALMSKLTLENFVTYLGGAGGAYSAYGSKNLAQMWYNEMLGGHPFNINVVQLEIVRSLRNTKAKAQNTGIKLAEAISFMAQLWPKIVDGSLPIPAGAMPWDEI